MINFNEQSTDSLEYNIIANNSRIGSIKIEKNTTNGIVEYTAVSHSSFKLFLMVDLSYKLNATYKNNELIFSTTSTYVNGKLHSTATAEKSENNTYILKNDGHEKRAFDTITYLGVLLYFQEPKNVKRVFSEFYNSFNPLTEIATHTYQLTNSENGNKSEYFYKNGILQKAIIHHKLMSFSLEKID